MKPSEIYFSGSIAAYDRLPAKSKVVINRLDVANTAWAKLGFNSPRPSDCEKARIELDNDPLATAYMNIRILGNEAAAKE